MLQNDWRDRYHDIRKHKVVASEHPRAFCGLVLAFWAGCIVLITLVTTGNTKAGFVLAVLALAGALYSETRKILFIPITLVSAVSATPALLPMAYGATRGKPLLLFLSAALIIFGRELTKDLEDMYIDKGYKLTIPLVAGERESRVLAAVAIVTGLIAGATVSLSVVLPATIVLVALIRLLSGEDPRRSRKLLDGGVAFIILILIITGGG